MGYIYQKQLGWLKKELVSGKVAVILGPRRCGKTTLLKHYIKETTDSETLLVTGEDLQIQEYLGSQSLVKLKEFVGKNKCLIIDEAQKIKNIGINLKMIVDQMPELKIIATGSSAFDLARQTGEPLAGRKITLRMFPLSQMELGVIENPAETASKLDERLIYGAYPEVVLSTDLTEKRRYLMELISSYLYRDILEVEGVRYSGKIIKLLQLLALQVGQNVSMAELGSQLGMSKNTVERYLDLLEQAFVLIRLNSYSHNPRKELSKSPHYFFYDIGVRNALINNFNPLNLRDDVGVLWENYIVMEMLKKQEYTHTWGNNYFWRTYDGQEIDFVVDRDGVVTGYECKYSKDAKSPVAWKRLYPRARYACINRANYLPYIA